MSNTQPIKVLFVCMGNICRSPMAEAVFRHQVAEAGLSDYFVIDSAGTGSWHAGERPHPGTLQILARHGIADGDQRARQVRSSDFTNFDYIVAMDRENLANLQAFAPGNRQRMRLLLEYAPELHEQEVPDPYYSGGFDYVYQLVNTACHSLLAHIRRNEGI
jgi:protein-tyrosine phosphatase